MFIVNKFRQNKLLVVRRLHIDQIQSDTWNYGGELISQFFSLTETEHLISGVVSSNFAYSPSQLLLFLLPCGRCIER